VFAMGPETKSGGGITFSTAGKFFDAWYKPGTSQAYCIDPIPTGTPFAGAHQGNKQEAKGFWRELNCA
jgi:hypothetical protein